MLTLYVVTHPTSSLAITDVRVSRLRPISRTPLSHRLHTTRVWLTWQHVLTLVPPVTFLGCSSSPHPYPRLPCPVPQHHQLRVKNERMTRSKPRSDVPRVRAHGSSFLLLTPSYQRIPSPGNRVALVFGSHSHPQLLPLRSILTCLLLLF